MSGFSWTAFTKLAAEGLRKVEASIDNTMGIQVQDQTSPEVVDEDIETVAPSMEEEAVREVPAPVTAPNVASTEGSWGLSFDPSSLDDAEVESSPPQHASSAVEESNVHGDSESSGLPAAATTSSSSSSSSSPRLLTSSSTSLQVPLPSPSMEPSPTASDLEAVETAKLLLLANTTTITTSPTSSIAEEEDITAASYSSTTVLPSAELTEAARKQSESQPTSSTSSSLLPDPSVAVDAPVALDDAVSNESTSIVADITTSSSTAPDTAAAVPGGEEAAPSPTSESSSPSESEDDNTPEQQPQEQQSPDQQQVTEDPLTAAAVVPATATTIDAEKLLERVSRVLHLRESAITKKNAEIASLKQLLAQAQEEAVQLRRHSQTLEENVLEATESGEALKKRCSALEAKCKSLEEKEEKTQQAGSRAAADASALSASNAEMQTRLDGALSEVAQMKKELAEVKRQVEVERRQAREAEALLNDSQTEMLEKNLAMGKLEEVIKVLRVELEEAAKAREADRAEWQAQREEEAIARAKVQEVEAAELAAVEAKLEAAQARIAELDDQVVLLSKDVARWKQLAEEAESEATSTADTSKQSEAKIEELGLKIKGLEASLTASNQRAIEVERSSAEAVNRAKIETQEWQLRCQEADRRNEDLATAVPEATRPLLRQIAAQQQAMNGLKEACAAAEASLRERVREAETQLAQARAERSVAVERVDRLSQRIVDADSLVGATKAALAEAEATIDTLRNERSVAQARLASLEARVKVADEAASSATKQVNELRTQLEEALAKASASAAQSSSASTAFAPLSSSRLPSESADSWAATFELSLSSLGDRLREEERGGATSSAGDAASASTSSFANARDGTAAMGGTRAGAGAGAGGEGSLQTRGKEGGDDDHGEDDDVDGADLDTSVATDSLNASGAGGRALGIADDVWTSMSVGTADPDGGADDVVADSSGASGSGPRAGAASRGGGRGYPDQLLGAGGAGLGGRGLPMLVEQLRSNLRRLEGEAQTLRMQLSEAEATRDSLTEELVALRARLGAAERRLGGMEQLETEMKEMETRYNAALDVIGEKEEELQELRGDLEHVKQTFRVQVSELLWQIEAATKQQQQNQTKGFSSATSTEASSTAAASSSTSSSDDSASGPQPS